VTENQGLGAALVKAFALETPFRQAVKQWAIVSVPEV